VNVIESVSYSETELYQAIALPFASSTLTMVCIVLKDPNAVPNKVINSDLLNDAVSRFEISEMFIQIPRFDVKSELMSLKKLILRAYRGPVSEILQRTAFGCYEGGTCPTPPVAGIEVPEYGRRFIVDRPFFFCVRDSESGAILLMGFIGRPIAVDLEPLAVEVKRSDSVIEIGREGGGGLDDGVFWTQIEHLGDPVAEVGDLGLGRGESAQAESEGRREMVNTPVDEERSDLWDFVYGDGVQPATQKEMENLFGTQTKNRVTYSKFTPWGNVEFHPPPEKTNLYTPPKKLKSPHRFVMKQ
jgi:hypothetical protein